MSHTILVTGATGTVGGATLRALQDAGTEPIAFVRSSSATASALGAGVPLRTGDLADEHSLRTALEGVDAVLLCSGHDPAMDDVQLAAVRAIAASDVSRVVKISGSPVAVREDSPAANGRAHWAVEEALRSTGRETVAVRPNVFMQTFFDQAPAIAHGVLPGPDGLPCVSFVDAGDIGRVAAAALVAERPPAQVLEVTGPAKFTWFDVASMLSFALGRPVVHRPLSDEALREALLAAGRPAWLVDHVLELAALMREPKAAEVTDTVLRMTGRAPVTFGEFLTHNAAAFPAAD